MNSQEGVYGSGLQTASYAGHESTVQLLLENGADVTAQGGMVGTAALEAASSRGHKGIVALLEAHCNTTGGHVVDTTS